MLKTELLEMIANGENSGVEFKRDDVKPEQLARECVAFANGRGGRVLLGVEDGGSLSGLTRPNCEEWVMDTVFQRYVHPILIPFYEEIVLDDGKKVGIVTVSQGSSKPYVLRNNNREEVYIRVGSTTQRASREQQARLFATGGLLHVETLPVSGTRFDDLDERRLRQYFSEVAGYGEVPDSQTDWEAALLNLDLMTQTEVAGTVCTIAGILLFGNAPRRNFPYAGLRVFVFPGEDKDYNALRDETVSEPLSRLWKTNDKSKILEEGLVSRGVGIIQDHISEETLGPGGTRERIWAYPPEAIRELLVNALVHRDYTRQVDIEVGVYSNRLEIISPGALPNGLTLEKMKSGQRIQRNPILVEILRDYGLTESRGMGIRRKVIPLMKAQNGREPDFEITEDYVKVTLFKAMV